MVIRSTRPHVIMPREDNLITGIIRGQVTHIGGIALRGDIIRTVAHTVVEG